MKNKIIFFLLIIFFNFKLALADQIIFKATEIQTTEKGNIIIGNGNAEAIANNGIEIYANKFTYNKNKKTLTANGAVKVIDKLKNITIISETIIYNELNQKITSYDFTKINIDRKYFIKTKNIHYDHLNGKIFTNFSTELVDLKNNKIKAQKFKYFLIDETIRGEMIEIIDIDKNEYFIKSGMVDLRKNLLQGKDVLVNLTPTEFEVPDAEPRIKGNSIYYGNQNTIIKKGVFTSCKKNDKCPPWMITSKEITHDKNKKQINYKNAWLKIYDVPVLYFPRFFHPDPSVKRQSGFLKPKFGDSRLLGSSINLPYFFAISESSDLTFTPRLFTENEFLLRSEYRKINKNSEHIFDFSVNKNPNDKKNGTKTHFFSKSIFNLDIPNLDTSYINLNLQKTSSDNYLKLYSLSSQDTIVSEVDVLESAFKFSASKNNLWLDLSFESYETIGKPNSDRYEFIYPYYTLNKIFNFNQPLIESLEVNSSGNQKIFNTNIFEAVQVNDFLIDTPLNITKSGFENNFQTLIKNVNSNGNNSAKFKKKTQSEILSMLIYNTSYPMQKFNKKYLESFTPKLSFRYSPNDTKNIKDNVKYLSKSNIFTLNRIGESESIEAGGSLTLGFEYKKQNEDDKKILSFDAATVLKDKKNNNLSSNSTLNQKQSDIVGGVFYSPLDFLNINYNFSLDHNLDSTNLHDLNFELEANNFVTTFEFYEENNQIGDKSYFGSEIKYLLDEENSFSLSTRKNKKNDLTEFYNLIYEYKNDCLTASFEYNKQYYEGNDIKPFEQLFFNITLIPLGSTQTENILKEE